MNEHQQILHYAHQVGTIKGIVSDIGCVCRSIEFNKNYKMMYYSLLADLRKELEKESA